MTVKLTGVVYPIDPWAVMAFNEIYNAIVLSRHAADLNCKLINAIAHASFHSIGEYFLWTFAEHSFILRQRIQARSKECFEGNVLEISYRQIDGSNASDEFKTA